GSSLHCPSCLSHNRSFKMAQPSEAQKRGTPAVVHSREMVRDSPRDGRVGRRGFRVALQELHKARSILPNRRRLAILGLVRLPEEVSRYGPYVRNRPCCC